MVKYQEESFGSKFKTSGFVSGFEDELTHLPDLIRTVATSTIPKPKVVREKNKRNRRLANKVARKARKK